MIQPTVGRVVWFRPAENDYRVGSSEEQPLAAIVAKVQGERLVNLCVIDANGDTHPRQNVPLLQDDDDTPESGCFCCWMPYQKGQAAKTEAMEKKLSEGTANASEVASPAFLPECEIRS